MRVIGSLSRSGSAKVALVYGVVPVQRVVPRVLFGVVGIFKVVAAFYAAVDVLSPVL